jgi:hypothetical protein
MVLPDSTGISRVPAYSGTSPRPAPTLRLRGSHPLWPRFPTSSTHANTRSEEPADPSRPALQPRMDNDCSLTTTRFGHPPLSLAATQGITVVSFSSGYLDVSVPPVRFQEPMCSAPDDRASPLPGSPIRTSRDQRSRATPPGFSQLATSFFADLCPGIHLMPLFA